MTDDAELIERYLQGDKMAGSLLVARHSSALFCWLRWKTGSQEEAEDLTQIVWCKAFPALPRLEDRAALRAWLFTIMRREFSQWLRERRPTCSLDALGETLDAAALHPLHTALDTVNDRLALQTALMQLSEEHHDTFMLRYLSQFSAAEVAQILDIPIGTVESRCHFARVQLKRFLQREAEHPADSPRAVSMMAGHGVGSATLSKPTADKKHWFKGHLK